MKTQYAHIRTLHAILHLALIHFVSMSSYSYRYFPLFFCSLYTILVSISHQARDALTSTSSTRSNTFSAVFVFGDSTVDSGNNNYISTPIKYNYPPYSKDCDEHVPRGRCTNGRVIPDFLASYYGIKEYVPPYLDPTLNTDELMTGVCFASACSGFDPFTPTLTLAVGKARTDDLVKNALFYVCCGTNDFSINYFRVPFRRLMYTVPQYQQFLLRNVDQFLQNLWQMGARKIAITGLPPFGCLPFVIDLDSDRSNSQRDCIESYNPIAKEYNSLFQNKLQQMQTELGNNDGATRLTYLDIYEPLADIVNNPVKYGFDVVNKGCCGNSTGSLSFLCNSAAQVCPDASKYLFWDYTHPTERAYQEAFRTFIPVINSMIIKS